MLKTTTNLSTLQTASSFLSPPSNTPPQTNPQHASAQCFSQAKLRGFPDRTTIKTRTRHLHEPDASSRTFRPRWAPKFTKILSGDQDERVLVREGSCSLTRKPYQSVPASQVGSPKKLKCKKHSYVEIECEEERMGP